MVGIMVDVGGDINIIDYYKFSYNLDKYMYFKL